MNRAEDILAFMRGTGPMSTLILAPKAPPVLRTVDGIKVAMPLVMDAGDVSDTVDGFKNFLPSSVTGVLGNSGRFSFSLPGAGRIRVSFATQRGSLIASVALIPFQIPSIHDVCENASDLDIVARDLESDQIGLVLVSGPWDAGNASLVYSMLQHVNEAQRKVICVVERALTYLMPHGDSIVTQSEVGADVTSIEEGLKNALMFRPDIVFVGDLRVHEDTPSISHLIASGQTTIITSEAPMAHLVGYRHMPARALDSYARARRKHVHIMAQPAANQKLRADVRTVSPQD